MNVPANPGQQVQAAPLPAAYGQTANTGNAQILGAVAQAAAKGGTEAAERARVLQARQDQTAIFNASADARAAADKALIQFAALDGGAALAAGPKLLEDYQSAVSERSKHLSPRQSEIFNQHATDIGAGLEREFGLRSLGISQKMVDASLANVIQTNTRSAFGVAVAGSVRFVQTPSLPASLEGVVEPGVSGTAGPAKLATGALDERWNAIKSAIEGYADSHEKSLLVDKATFTRTATEKARADFDAGVIEGLLTPSPGKPVDWRTAQQYLKQYGGNLSESDRQRLGAAVDNATEAGTVTEKSSSAFARFAGEAGTWTERSDKMADWIETNTPEPYRAKALAAKNTMVAAAKVREEAQNGEAQDQMKKALESGVPPSQVFGSSGFNDLRLRDPSKADALRDYANALARGDHSVTNPKVYDAVDRALRDDPQALTVDDIDQRVMKGLLSKEDGTRFKERITNAEKLSGILTPDEMASMWAQERYPSDGEAVERGKLKIAANAAILGFERVMSRKPNTLTETPAILDAIVTETVYQPDAFLFFDDDGSAFETFPADVLELAVEQHIALTGEVPTASDLALFWRRWKAGGD